MKAITEIKKILNWYYKHSSSASITDLLDNQDKLSIWACNLGEFAGELFGQFNNQYLIRRIGIAKTKQALIKNGSAIGKADSEALIENEEYYRQEIQSQIDAYTADILLKQTNKVMDAMRTRISYLKTERENVSNNQ